MSLYKDIKTQVYLDLWNLLFCLLCVLFFDLSAPEKTVLIPPNAVIDVSIPPFSSVGLDFLYCWVYIYYDVYTFFYCSFHQDIMALFSAAFCGSSSI